MQQNPKSNGIAVVDTHYQNQYNWFLVKAIRPLNKFP